MGILNRPYSCFKRSYLILLRTKTALRGLTADEVLFYPAVYDYIFAGRRPGKKDLIRLPECPEGFIYISLESPGMIIRLVPVRDQKLNRYSGILMEKGEDLLKTDERAKGN